MWIFNVKERLKVNLNGLEFDNVLGLAAGFDTDCSMAEQLFNLGFGFVEVGSVSGSVEESEGENGVDFSVFGSLIKIRKDKLATIRTRIIEEFWRRK